MTYTMKDHSSESLSISGPEQAGETFDELVREILWHGDSGQSLWIGPDTKKAKMVQALSGPSEEAGEIVWTPDGKRVAFIINGYQLRMFDAASGSALGAVVIIDPDGFPSSRIARGVTFSSNGAAITYDDCPRAQSGCKPGILAIKQ